MPRTRYDADLQHNIYGCASGTIDEEIAEWYHFEDKNQLKATSRWWRARSDI